MSFGARALLQLSFDRPARHVAAGAKHSSAPVHGHSANWSWKICPNFPKDNLLGEPIGRDTANAVGFPAAVLLERDKDAVFAVTTADHVIEPVELFQTAIKTGFDVTAKFPSMLVTFASSRISATRLGYVQRGEALAASTARSRSSHSKKAPDKPTADRYVESGRYYWNSGHVCLASRHRAWRAPPPICLSLHGSTKDWQSWNTPIATRAHTSIRRCPKSASTMP